MKTFIYIVVLVLSIGVAILYAKIAAREATQAKAYAREAQEWHVRYLTTVIPSTDRRYFLIAYSTREKSNYNEVTGNTWFSSDSGFCSKKSFDESVYRSLPRKRKCYQHIIITSIFEFKNADDFNAFDADYKGDKDLAQQKECCDSVYTHVRILGGLSPAPSILIGQLPAYPYPTELPNHIRPAYK